MAGVVEQGEDVCAGGGELVRGGGGGGEGGDTYASVIFVFLWGLGRLEVGGVGCEVVVLDYVPVGIPRLRARG